VLLVLQGQVPPQQQAWVLLLPLLELVLLPPLLELLLLLPSLLLLLLPQACAPQTYERQLVLLHQCCCVQPRSCC
jgi:hypothetical protein